MARLKNEILYLESDELKEKMREVIAHFSEDQVRKRHCFYMLGGPIESTTVQKTALIMVLSCALILVEIVVYAQFKQGD